MPGQCDVTPVAAQLGPRDTEAAVPAAQSSAASSEQVAEDVALTASQQVERNRRGTSKTSVVRTLEPIPSSGSSAASVLDEAGVQPASHRVCSQTTEGMWSADSGVLDIPSSALAEARREDVPSKLPGEGPAKKLSAGTLPSEHRRKLSQETSTERA